MGARSWGQQAAGCSGVTASPPAIELSRPKPQAPRLTASTPSACGEFIRQWDEFARDATAVDEKISVRSCMPDTVLATACWLSDFPTSCVPSISDAELLGCSRSVVWPDGGTAVDAMYGERNGRIKERYDRGQLPSLEYGGFNAFKPQCVYRKSDARPRHGYVGREIERVVRLNPPVILVVVLGRPSL